MPRQLKVFVAQFGFYDTVIAVPSQAAALKAWGIRVNLFADGTARVADDPQAIEAALANPGVLLKRGVGTGDPFGLNPRLPSLPDLPPASANAAHGPTGGRVAKPATEKPSAKLPPPPDRSALDDAEKALAEVDRQWRDQEGGFRKRRAALDAEEEQARVDHERDRRQAEADRRRAQMVYDRASSANGPGRRGR